jgi:hypothetical protein
MDSAAAKTALAIWVWSGEDARLFFDLLAVSTDDSLF